MDFIEGATPPAHLMDADFMGNEHIDANALSIPRLYLLQALSKPAIKGNPEFVPGAQAGMFLNSISKELYNELFVSNLFMTRGFNVNKRQMFGTNDWRGFFPTLELALAKLTADNVNPADYDIMETHTHTLAVIDPLSGAVLTPIQVSMKGTGLRYSRSWNTTIITHVKSQLPRYAALWKLTAQLHIKNKQSWYTSIWKKTSNLNTNPNDSWHTPLFIFAGWAPDEVYSNLHELFNRLISAAPVAFSSSSGEITENNIYF